jgi:hypothetical protein
MEYLMHSLLTTENSLIVDRSESGVPSSIFEITIQLLYVLKKNGNVEATNKTFFRTLKKKLEQKKGAWVEFVPEVLWSYRTTIRTPIGKTSFSPTFWD